MMGCRLFKSEMLQRCLLALVGVMLTPTPARPQGRVDVAFELLRATVTVNEPVFVRFSVDNGLQQGVLLDLGYNRTGNFDLVVVGPDGLATPAPPVEAGGVHRAGKAYAPPGGSFNETLLISERYQFTRAGTYRLKMRFSGPMGTDSGPVTVPPAQELTLGVSPRDPKRLEEVCETLLKSASGTSNYEKLREAAVALSYVTDAVAVRYLGDLLAKHNSVSEVAIEGLVRIGNPEALQTLTANLNTPDPNLRMKIQFGIEEIKTGVHSRVMD